MGMKSTLGVAVLAGGVALSGAVKEANAQNINTPTSEGAAIVQTSRDTYKEMAEKLLNVDENQIEKASRRVHIEQVFTVIDGLGGDYTKLKAKLDEENKDTSLYVLKSSRKQLNNLLLDIKAMEASAEGKAASAEGKAASAEGKAASAEGKAASAEGKAAEARGKAASAEGKAAEARGKAASAEGKAAEARGEQTKTDAVKKLAKITEIL